ncbi:putative clostridium epsilon toxin ETX/ mosquitocidal toxin MTX2 [Rosa chinensis]|uniref:Putative clostridium epsilon toxin ETX/ mosquitocidal toxin MTX2 n=2 Tax=Rosa chinensis TaxID=74649 RepID=A0A2P6QFU5_ROSCH|nr:putative clostridium epsilon toxin ETX/ mosquitocidal toxin MTX2 [Rosa chinensis]
MRLEELVLSRKIYNVDFDLKNAITYSETPVTMAIANASNDTSAENTVEFKFAYKDGKSNMWKASHSWMVGLSVSASFKIPFIGGTDVTTSAEYSGSYE